MKLTVETPTLHGERIEAYSRVIPGAVAGVLISIYFSHYGFRDPLKDTLLQHGVWLYVLAGIGLLADTYLRPEPRYSRVVLGVSLDVAGVSAGLYAGAGIVDPTALFYLWTLIGSGMVYGSAFLLFSAVLSTVGFSVVWALSPHWQSQPLFSLTVLLMVVMLCPYLISLTNTLHASRREVLWQANHDPLTRLLNRRAFHRELDREMQENRARKFMLSFDLDHFKAVNDAAGHAAGDQVLNDVTEMLTQHVPSSSVVARMGGDEFCVLLTATTEDDARQTAEAIRSEIDEYRLGWGRLYFEIGVSIGIARATAAPDASALLRLADAACYVAKNNGRNQVYVIDDDMQDIDTQRLRKMQFKPRLVVS